MRFVNDLILTAAMVAVAVPAAIAFSESGPSQISAPMAEAPTSARLVAALARPSEPLAASSGPVDKIDNVSLASGTIGVMRHRSAAAPPPDAAHDWVRVSVPRLNLRAKPRIEAEWLASYPAGSRLERIDMRGEWILVRDPDSGTSGWMAARYVTDEAPSPVVSQGT